MINQWNQMEVPYLSGNPPYVYIYMKLYMNMYTYHTYKNTYIHACRHTYISYTFIHHACIQTNIQTCRSGCRSWVAEGRMDHSVSQCWSRQFQTSNILSHTLPRDCNPHHCNKRRGYHFRGSLIATVFFDREIHHNICSILQCEAPVRQLSWCT